MPIIVDPTFIPPAGPTTVVSPDGYLTATLDAPWAGVRLVADFSTLGSDIEKVAFFRDGQPVRSGDLAWAPGGVAVAYDHEAPLGVVSSWSAVAYFRGGDSPGSTSTPALLVPLPDGGAKLAWLKSVDTPSASLRVKILEFREAGRDPRASLQPVIGSAYPTGTRDTLTGLAATLTVRTDTQAEYDALLALLDTQWMLLQTPDWMGIPADLYCMATGPMAASRLGGHTLGWAQRAWDIPLVQLDRPATVDAPLLIPGVTWDSVAATYATWDALTAAVPTWLDLLEA